MYPRVLAIFGGALFCLATLDCTKHSKPPSRAVIVHTSATTASDLKAALSRVPEITVQPVTPGGLSVTSLEDLQRGTTDVGIAMADVTYLAFAGQLDQNPRAFDQLRGMAVLNLNSLHLIVGARSRVDSVDDLRELHVALGPVGSATALLAEMLLHAYGLDRAQVRGERLPYMAAAEQIVTGDLDAAFMTQTPPADPVLLATKAGARLIDIAGPRVEELRARHPFLKRTLIPAGTYPNQGRAIHTVGVDLLLLCRADMDEDVVYRLLEGYFATGAGSVPPIDLERAPATPIPLHAGAARYYRQRELAR
jgi:TRAP transporter TAXI family solute receptor